MTKSERKALSATRIALKRIEIIDRIDDACGDMAIPRGDLLDLLKDIKDTIEMKIALYE